MTTNTWSEAVLILSEFVEECEIMLREAVLILSEFVEEVYAARCSVTERSTSLAS